MVAALEVWYLHVAISSETCHRLVAITMTRQLTNNVFEYEYICDVIALTIKQSLVKKRISFSWLIIMDNFQNQYGAVPISNNDLIHRELDTTGVNVDGGGSTQAMADTTTAVDTTTTDDGVFVDGNKTNNHHNKKGIIDKIKDKLPGTHHHK